MSNQQEIRTAVIGLGAMGSVHAKRLFNKEISGLKLSAVCDRQTSQSASFPAVRFYSDWQKLITSKELDAVIIATPHYDHAAMSVEALRQGLHVLVEKPMGVRKSDCEELLRAHAASDRILAVMLSMRVRPLYQKIRGMIRAGELGALHRVTWIATDWFRTQAYYRSSDWRGTWKGEGGGLLLNQCPHQLDLWCWMFGLPNEVSAFCTEGRYHDIETEDDVTAFLSYDDGMRGVFIASTGESPGTNRLEVVGENGKLIAEDGKLIFFRNAEPMTAFSHKTATLMGTVKFEQTEIPLSPPSVGHVGLMQNFADAIRQEVPLLAPGTEGIQGVELANAMHLSSWKHEPVSLPLNTGLFDQLLRLKIEQEELATSAA